jgi:ATP/maltotriose-dependent transcriptional regulator MalT
MEPLNTLPNKIFIQIIRPQSVFRKHLPDQANDNFMNHLIPVLSGAGYGKRTLTCKWIHRQCIQLSGFHGTDPGSEAYHSVA